MYGYQIKTDYHLMEDHLVNLGTKRKIYCYRDDQISQREYCSSKTKIGANAYNTILAYRCLEGKYISIKEMGEFYIRQNHIKYHVTSRYFSEEAICTTILTHIIGNVLIGDSYLLHATTLLKNNNAVCFLGCSGSGKSTLSLKLSLDYGYSLISDDMTSIIQKDKEVLVTLGNPYTKIWSDTLMHFRENNKLKNIAIKNVYRNEGKYIFRLPGNLNNEEQFPLKAIMILNKKNGSLCDLRRLSAIDSFAFLYNNNYIRYACSENEIIMQAKLLCRIISQIPTYLFTYPDGFEHLDDVAKYVETL